MAQFFKNLDNIVTKGAKTYKRSETLMSPCLVVMGGDSCSEGCGFKSQHRILDGKISHLFVVRIVMSV